MAYEEGLEKKLDPVAEPLNSRKNHKHRSHVAAGYIEEGNSSKDR